ncbi:RTA1 like protein-domain-containing protein [Mycena latifolia]|nr:RTA1 like protein-domain-containing protein [Mycena latifolia]
MSNSTTTPSGGDDNQYGYTPSQSIGILFVVLFGISTVLHTAQATYYRMWWLLPTACLCGVGELVGWAGRLWSSSDPTLSDPYMMQITTTIISPTPLIAVNFILLSRIVQRLGVCYSRLAPRWYTRIFLSCDIIALVIQGAGGGLAASANDQAGSQMGANIMLAGIAFQFGTVCAGEFLRRYALDLPLRGEAPQSGAKALLTRRLRLMIAALAFSTLVLFIRSVYRLIELSGGWNGRVIQTEVYFNVLDGGMVVLAIYTMNIAHPGLLLRQTAAEDIAEKQVDSTSSAATLDP